VPIVHEKFGHINANERMGGWGGWDRDRDRDRDGDGDGDGDWDWVGIGVGIVICWVLRVG